MKIKVLLTLIPVLSICQVATSQHSTKEKIEAAAPSASKLKSVKLDEKYTIEVPDYLSVNRQSSAAAAAEVSFFTFESQPPHSTTIQAEILPLTGELLVNKDTGKLVPPTTGDLTCEVEPIQDPMVMRADGGVPLTRYFTTADSIDVYYGCAVMDNAYECSMNSQCPLPVPRRSRYTTEYAFAVFDKENGLILQLTGSHDGPSKKVTGFKGDGRLLRDTIAPSLSRIK